jgi:uncharacterized membrane protein YhaH (DUF805 family)
MSSNTAEVWRRKTDDEIGQAAASLDEYTEEGRRVILEEIARRGLNVVVAVESSKGRLTLTQCYLRGWTKFALFRGRAGRRECFTFVIANTVTVGTLLMMNLLNAAGVILIAMQLPSLALQVRRLHDTGKSGWWLLVGLIPVVGWVAVLAMLLKDSEAGENQYGVTP